MKTLLERKIEKMEELIGKKGNIIHHLIKIILRNSSKITLRQWESSFIHEYPEIYSKIESELADLNKEIEDEKRKQAMPSHSERDWVEDFSHENGNYTCKCCKCGMLFYGHKRRPICKVCASKEIEEQTKGMTAEEFIKIKHPRDYEDIPEWHLKDMEEFAAQSHQISNEDTD